MRTTIDIDKKLLDDVVKSAGEKTLSKAVNKALSEYVRRRKLEELRGLIGKMGLTDDWRTHEEAEIQEMEKQP